MLLLHLAYLFEFHLSKKQSVFASGFHEIFRDCPLMFFLFLLLVFLVCLRLVYFHSLKEIIRSDLPREFLSS